MSFTTSIERTNPSNWSVQSNDGTNLTAVNVITKETFNGTLVDFNNLLSQTVPTFDPAVASPVVLVDPSTGVAYAAGGGGGGGADREFVVTTYRCKTVFTGASVGDTITGTQVYDVSTATPTLSATIWYNQSTAAVLASAPAAANLEIVGSNALTDAQLRASAVPVSGPLTSAQLTSAGLATNTTAEAIRDRLPNTLLGTRLAVEPLGVPGVARQLAAGAASTNTVLTAGVSRISMYANGADIRYTVGSSAQTASSTSHFIASGERLDIDVPSTANIAVIRAGSTDGTLELTELS